MCEMELRSRLVVHCDNAPDARGVPTNGNSIATALSDPAKPWHYGVNNSFNGELRDERLSLEWFRS